MNHSENNGVVSDTKNIESQAAQTQDTQGTPKDSQAVITDAQVAPIEAQEMQISQEPQSPELLEGAQVEETSETQDAQAIEKSIPITTNENAKPDNSVSVETNANEKKKKFSFGKFIFKWFFILLILAIAISALYLRFSQINSMQYQSGADNSMISQLFKAAPNNGMYEAKISPTNFNKFIASTKNELELPIDLKATNVFYDNVNTNIIVNADNSFISTSLILAIEYTNSKLKIVDMKLGNLSIPFSFASSFVDIFPIHTRLHESNLVNINEINFSTDGVYIKYELDKSAINNIKNSLKKLQRSNIVEYGNKKQNSELSTILFFSQEDKASKFQIADEDFILRLLSDKKFTINVFATLDRNSRVKFAEILMDEIGFASVLEKDYFEEIIELSNDRYAFYMKDIEVSRLTQSLEEQAQSFEQIKEEKQNLAEKLDIYMLPEVATWNTIKASSEYRQNDIHHRVSFLDDNDDKTYWATVENNGIGETITFESVSSFDISTLKIKNGILSDKEYQDNNRIQRLLLEFSNGNSKIIELDDRNSNYQEFSVNEDNIVWVKATILKVRTGRAETEENKAFTGITEMHFELKKQL